MAQSKSFTIADKIFKTKKELKLFTQTILNKYEIEKPLDASDFDFLSELLKRHTEYDKKVGCGIKEMVIRPDGYWGKTRCFYIKRTDGTETDFSYIHCIDNDTSREPEKMFKQSARSAIKDQIVPYLANYIKRTVDSSGNVVCQKSQAKIPKTQATVDHIPPITFDKIVTDFMQIKNINPSKIEYTGFDDNEFHKQFKDEDLREEFANYHKQVAKLRVVSLHQNLTQKKKSTGEQIALEL